MSELSKKYGIPETAVKAMVKDGWITCNATQYEEIYYTYKQELKKIGNPVQARGNVAITYNISDRWVYEIVKRFE